MKSIWLGILVIGAAVSAGDGWAQTAPFTLSIRNHRFEPETLTVPAGQKVEIHVRNTDPTPEEFESPVLRREKVVPAGQEIVMYVGPLQPGAYEFFGEFNPDTARGRVVAR